MGEPGDRRIRTVVRKFDKSLTVKAESLAGRFGAIEHSARQGAVEKQRVFGGRVGTEGRSGRHEFCKSVGLGAEVKFGGFQPISCTAVEMRCEPCDDHVEQGGKAGDQSGDRSDRSNGLRIKREQEKHILSFC